MPVPSRDDGRHKTDASKHLRFRLDLVVILVGLSQPLHPQQLPFGRVIPAHEGIQPLNPDHLGAEGLGGLDCRRPGGAGRHAPAGGAGGAEGQGGDGEEERQDGATPPGPGPRLPPTPSPHWEYPCM